MIYPSCCRRGGSYNQVSISLTNSCTKYASVTRVQRASLDRPRSTLNLTRTPAPQLNFDELPSRTVLAAECDTTAYESEHEV